MQKKEKKEKKKKNKFKKAVIFFLPILILSPWIVGWIQGFSVAVGNQGVFFLGIMTLVMISRFFFFSLHYERRVRHSLLLTTTAIIIPTFFQIQNLGFPFWGVLVLILMIGWIFIIIISPNIDHMPAIRNTLDMTLAGLSDEKEEQINKKKEKETYSILDDERFDQENEGELNPIFFKNYVITQEAEEDALKRQVNRIREKFQRTRDITSAKIRGLQKELKKKFQKIKKGYIAMSIIAIAIFLILLLSGDERSQNFLQLGILVILPISLIWNLISKDKETKSFQFLKDLFQKDQDYGISWSFTSLVKPGEKGKKINNPKKDRGNFILIGLLGILFWGLILQTNLEKNFIFFKIKEIKTSMGYYAKKNFIDYKVSPAPEGWQDTLTSKTYEDYVLNEKKIK